MRSARRDPGGRERTESSSRATAQPQDTTVVAPGALAQTSFVTATIMPASTNTTIAICIQIHVGDMTRAA
jgi:hypothetical protein